MGFCTSGGDKNTTAPLASQQFEISVSDSDKDSSNTVCEPQTKVFVTVGGLSPNPSVRALLANSLQNVKFQIDSGHLGQIPAEGWRQIGRNAVSMVVFSEVHNPTTWVTLYGALQVLQTWMSSGGRTWGTCSFAIWNGNYQVGHGSINGPPFSLNVT